MAIQRDFTVGVQKRCPVVGTPWHYDLGSNVVYETLELHLYFPSRRQREATGGPFIYFYIIWNSNVSTHQGEYCLAQSGFKFLAAKASSRAQTLARPTETSPLPTPRTPNNTLVWETYTYIYIYVYILFFKSF